MDSAGSPPHFENAEVQSFLVGLREEYMAALDIFLEKAVKAHTQPNVKLVKAAEEES